MLEGKVFITGGAGFLGRAILRRASAESWPCTFTIYSRDPIKQQKAIHEFPDVVCILGDVRDAPRLSLAMAGHDTVIHAAAMKHIPEGERNPIDMMTVNVSGSLNVGLAAIANRVKRVVGISTDKACHAINAYGASKFLMERMFQELTGHNLTAFHLTRYGNVLSSTGSVLTEWQRMAAEQGYVTATSPDMTRFWLTDERAVDLILLALSEPSGTVTIPRLPSCTMRQMAEWLMPSAEFRYEGLRPGEKRHEVLLTCEESRFVERQDDVFRLWPVTGRPMRASAVGEYRSDTPDRYLTPDELRRMVGEA